MTATGATGAGAAGARRAGGARTGSRSRRRGRRRSRSWRALAPGGGGGARDRAEDVRSWVRVENGDGLSFRPVFVRRYAHRLLWAHAARFVLMSATIVDPEQYARDLGLQADEW